MEAMEVRIFEFRLAKEAVEEKQAAQQKIIDEVAGKRQALASRRRALRKDEDNLRRKLTGLVPSFPNVFRNLPMVDFIDPSIRVRQVVLADLRNELNFTRVPRVDRLHHVPREHRPSGVTNSIRKPAGSRMRRSGRIWKRSTRMTTYGLAAQGHSPRIRDWTSS